MADHLPAEASIPTQRTRTELTGQVLHIRKTSKNIVFFDLTESHDNKPGNDRTTVVVKDWLNRGSVRAVTRGKDKIHTGDIVRVDGDWDPGAQSLTLTSYEVLTLWSEVNPLKAFIPIPPTSTKGTKNATEDKEDNKNDSSASARPGVCKYFVNTGRCEVANCKYSHASSAQIQAERAAYVRERLDKRRLCHESNFIADESSRGAHVSGDLAPSAKRAEVFAEWLVSRYGRSYLTSGTILDIAGGRGDLSFELTAKLGLASCVVDIRRGQLKRWQHKLLKKQPELKRPTHIQKWFDDDFFYSKDADLKASDVSLIVGLHPDQATEALVDTALRHRIPVAVVPCCVFSQDNPHRVLTSGRPVQTYEDFCIYIQEKSSRFKSAHLRFQGKNQVLYTLPELESPKQ